MKSFVFSILFFLIFSIFSLTANFLNSSDLSLHVISAPANVVDGEEIRYGINIKNNGPDVASSVVMKSSSPQNLIDCKFSIDGGNTWFLWNGSLNLGNIEPDSVKFINLKCRVKSFDSNYEISNRFTVSCLDDPDLSNNVVVIKNGIIPVSDIGVKIYSDNNHPEVGKLFRLKFSVKNLSKTISKGVFLNVSIPSGISKIAEYNLNWGNLNLTTRKWWIGDLPGGKEISLTLFLKLNYYGRIKFFARLNSKTLDMDESNNFAILTLFKDEVRDLSISLLPDRDKIYTCGKLYYHVILRNTGSCDFSEKISVKFDFPEDLEILDFNSDDGFFAPDGKWILNGLKRGECAHLDLYVKYHNSREYFVRGTIFNEDDCMEDNSYTSVVNKGERFTENTLFEYLNGEKQFLNVENFFIMEAYNGGTDDSKDLTVDFSIPDNFQIVNFFSSSGEVNLFEGKWFIRNLNHKKAETLVLVVIPLSEGNFSNEGNLTPYDWDPFEDDNFFNKSFEVIKASDLRLSIDIDNHSPFVGEDFNITLKVENKGPFKVDVADVLLNLGDFFTISQINGDGTFDIKNYTWSVGDLDVGDVKILNLTLFENENSLNFHGFINIGSQIVSSLPEDYFLPDNFSSSQIFSGIVAKCDLSVNVVPEKLILNPEERDSFSIYVFNSGEYFAYKSFLDISFSEDVELLNYNFPVEKISETTYRVFVRDILPSGEKNVVFTFLPILKSRTLNYQIFVDSTFSTDIDLENNVFRGKISITSATF